MPNWKWRTIVPMPRRGTAAGPGPPGAVLSGDIEHPPWVGSYAIRRDAVKGEDGDARAAPRYAGRREAARDHPQHRWLRRLLLARPAGPPSHPPSARGAGGGGGRHGGRLPEHDLADPREPGDRREPARPRRRRQPHPEP